MKKSKFKGFYTPKKINDADLWNYGVIYRVELDDDKRYYLLTADSDSRYIGRRDLDKLYKKASPHSIQNKIDYYKEKLAIYESSH